MDSWIPHGEDFPVKNSQEVVPWLAPSTGRRHEHPELGRQPHPVENMLAIFTLVVGLVSFVLGMLIRNTHTGAAVIVIATATGLVSCLVGLYVQMISPPASSGS